MNFTIPLRVTVIAFFMALSFFARAQSAPDTDCAKDIPVNAMTKFSIEFDEQGYAIWSGNFTDADVRCYIFSPRNHMPAMEKKWMLALWNEHQKYEYMLAARVESAKKKIKVELPTNPMQHCFPVDPD